MASTTTVPLTPVHQVRTIITIKDRLCRHNNNPRLPLDMMVATTVAVSRWEGVEETPPSMLGRLRQIIGMMIAVDLDPATEIENEEGVEGERTGAGGREGGEGGGTLRGRGRDPEIGKEHHHPYFLFCYTMQMISSLILFLCFFFPFSLQATVIYYVGLLDSVQAGKDQEKQSVYIDIMSCVNMVTSPL